MLSLMPGTCGFCFRASDCSKIHFEPKYAAILCSFLVQQVSAVFGALHDGRNAQKFYSMITSRTL